MKKKKVTLSREYNIWNDELIKVGQENNQYFFEIGQETTVDLAEAVAILMRMRSKWEDDIWNLELSNIDLENISPEKCLYWLSGGDEEWQKLEHYTKPWHQYYINFQEEFGISVINILSRSKTLKDVRSGFLKYLNLPTIYEFAVKSEMVY